ncbi:autotransporter outer membrane beta-barrel domain-containing protein [Scandinavium sp. TWS1a]|uniref:autotransporter outer membrane beta-barrel domain-containing protein n=1 Tax=Scandinavium tedordense TaxID=2926521 RepID=UPI0021656959|nr:autotransporter outer membrane beta-barrel domain-containing protein [Scandinavium tedordense]MCS2169865.1 autotransporter outer membrane beta-barrel domain-containing protein [Scandinavium tedordense]
MHSWKNKLVVSQLAVACALAIASQANAGTDISNTTYETFVHHNDTTSADGVYYDGYVGWNNYETTSVYGGDIYPVINNAVVNGVISTYYLDDGLSANSNQNTLNINNSTIHGMITSQCMTTDCDNRTATGYIYDRLALTVDNSTIDDNYEHYTYNGTHTDGTPDSHVVNVFDMGTAITLDQEVDLTIQNNSHVAGITLSQGYEWEDVDNNTVTTGVNSGEVFNNTIVVKDSVVTSGSLSDEGTEGWFGRSDNASDYANEMTANDVALAVIANPLADNAMQTTATFSNSTLTGDVVFSSNFDENFFPGGADSYRDTDSQNDTNGWDGTDSLNLTLDNGSKWVGAAMSVHQVDTDGDGVNDSIAAGTDATATLYDINKNSLWPYSTYGSENNDSAFNEAGHVVGNQVYQSGLFNVTLDHGSEWDTRKSSLIDTLTVNNGSQVNVESSQLISDSITLNNASEMQIGDGGYVAADSVNLNSYSTLTLTEETAELYANTVNVDGNAQFNLGLGQLNTADLQLTNGGTFNLDSRDFVLNGDMINGHTNDHNQANYGYGVVAMNSDGHLAVNGDVAGNYKVRIDNATGAGSEKDYEGNELIRVYDDNEDTSATFTAANKADLGAYTYEAKQTGDTVVLRQGELTDYANMALSIPSANTNIWNLQQDTLETRLSNARHGMVDDGGVWVSYFGGNFDGDNGVLSYDQDVNGIMVGLDTEINGNYANWTVGAAASFAKGDMSDKSGQVDQDSQSAYIYSSARWSNDVFFDANMSYSRFSNDLSANMSDGQYVDGDSTNDAWGFGLKLGYDFKYDTAGYVTPYGAISGLFQSGDDYRLSNDMRMDGQSYDSMRYELGIDTGYTFTYSEDQALTPYFKLAYVYDDAGNDANVNGDNIDNGVKGSAVRVGAGAQFNFTKKFSAYTDANYLGGGDVDQNWAANVGVKYTW